MSEARKQAMRPGAHAVRVQRHEGEASAAHEDHVIDEQPVALVFNGLSHVVLMATPVHLEELALGFALSEGLIDAAAECRDLHVLPAAEPGLPGLEVHLEVSPRAFERIKTRRRHLEGRTGCGLCGTDSLKAFQASLPGPLRPGILPAHAPTPDSARLPEAVWRAIAQLPRLQALLAATGGCHAAAWLNPEGHIEHLLEDVGRHNALDKLIGTLAGQGKLGEPGLMLVSSRASYEMVAKCVRVGIHTLAALSAPTSMAVALARQSGLRLYGFCRPGSLVAYEAS